MSFSSNLAISDSREIRLYFPGFRMGSFRGCGRYFVAFEPRYYLYDLVNVRTVFGLSVMNIL